MLHERFKIFIFFKNILKKENNARLAVLWPLTSVISLKLNVLKNPLIIKT
jgi:hypothetical protein